MRTLCIDIGGSGIKAMTLDASGTPLTERARMETPDPSGPDAVFGVIDQLLPTQGEFDRVSVGFPGVVQEGVVRTAPNLGTPEWAGYRLADELERRTQKPVRVCNDAGIQGLAVIEGKGVEMLVCLGTGMGFGLYVDGRYVPNIEMAHHPLVKGKTYEERVGNAARKKVGNARWNKRVRQAIAQLEPIFNYRRLWLGGGNAKHLDREGLPENVTIIENTAGLLGGIKLWN